MFFDLRLGRFVKLVIKCVLNKLLDIKNKTLIRLNSFDV